MVKKTIIVPRINNKPSQPIEILIRYDIKEVQQLDPKKIGIILYGYMIQENTNNPEHYLFYKKNNITIYLLRSNNITKDKIYLNGTNLKSTIKYEDIFELSVKSLIKIDRSLNL
tara:strand:+ start:35 stop:376 length:342 start_codon:yes stop_codon:yes gene_type:complete